MMSTGIRSRRALSVTLLLVAIPALAHVQEGQAAGFLTGLAHPVSGLDHVLAMVAVGLWGAQLGVPAIWLLPVTFPLVMAFGGFLGLVGIPLNPANLISLPLIVGVGVDHGVHILHDYSEKEAGKLYRLSVATGRGIAVAALTTILGFGTLTLARHRGMAGMGLTLALGVTCCMVAALVVHSCVFPSKDEPE